MAGNVAAGRQKKKHGAGEGIERYILIPRQIGKETLGLASASETSKPTLQQYTSSNKAMRPNPSKLSITWGLSLQMYGGGGIITQTTTHLSPVFLLFSVQEACISLLCK